MKLAIKKINRNRVIEILFILAVTLIVCSGFLSGSIYKGYDLTFHLNRLVGIKEALQDHQILPKLYPYTNNGYGYASSLFYCDLFLYPFAILYYLGIPLVVSYKLMIGFYALLTSILVFSLTKKVSRSNMSPYIVTLIYVSSSYYLFDIYARAALGEVFAFCFIPFVSYEIYRLIIRKEDNSILLGLSFTLLLESHLISFVLVCAVFFVSLVAFTFINRKNRNEVADCIKTTFKAVVVALVLSAWYLFPMIEQFLSQKFWVNELGKLYEVKNTVQDIQSLFYPFITIDDVIDNHGEAGIFTILGIGILLPLLSFGYIKSKKNRYINILLVIVLFLSLFLYGIIPVPSFMDFIQFLYRFNILIGPILCIVILYSIENMKDGYKKGILALSLLYLVFNILSMNQSVSVSDRNISNSDTREVIFDFENVDKDYNEYEMGGAEYLPVTLYTDYLNESSSIKELRQDEYVDLTYDYDRSFSRITFTLDFDEEKVVMLPQSYYLGYKAYEITESGKKEIEVFTTEKYKQVCFKVEEGHHTYTCHYEGTSLQKITLIVSVLGVIGTVILSYSKMKKKGNC